VKGSWTKEEDQKILELVNKYGKSWSKISKILVSRNGKQIRDRFINILDPSIKKGKFSIDEDLKLLNLYRKLGPKWATISKFFENRTADMVKNRFHSSIKKNIKFLEDVEADFSYSGIKQDLPFNANEEFSNFQTFEDSSSNFVNFLPEDSPMNVSQYYEEEKSLQPIYNNNNMKIDLLKEEHTINLNFLQSAQTAETFSPSWQLEDYFII